MVNLTDASGVSVADYSYDTWGALTNSSESIPNAGGWVNPYRYDGRDGVRSDTTTGLDWMAVRAYDPTIGHFISRDPLGRAPLVFADNPYVYAGNNPLSNVDPSGQYRAAGFGSAQRESGQATNQQMAHIVTQRGCDYFCEQAWHQRWLDQAKRSPVSQRHSKLEIVGREYYIAAGSWTSAVSYLASMRQSMCWG